MNQPISQTNTWCLTHQLPETQASPYGLVCECCKKSLYLSPPKGKVKRYWEKMPGAFSLLGTPYYVHVMAWRNFAIRSLHLISSGPGAKPALTQEQVDQIINADMETLADLLKQRGLIAEVMYDPKDDAELEFDLNDEELEFDLNVSGFDFEPPKEYDPDEKKDQDPEDRPDWK